MIGWLVFVASVFVVCVAPLLVVVAEALDKARSSVPYEDDVPARPHVRVVPRRAFDWQHDDRDMAAMGEATHG